MSTTDEIRQWSEELARDPASLVFLQLAEALRRQGSAIPFRRDGQPVCTQP